MFVEDPARRRDQALLEHNGQSVPTSTSRSRSRGGDPWIIAEARELGFEADAGSNTIACYGWPLPFLVLPSFWLTYSRILIVGHEHSALFKADVTRQDPRRLLWSGKTSELRWRTVFRWLLRGDTPAGLHGYVDAPAERQRLRDFLDRGPSE